MIITTNGLCLGRQIFMSLCNYINLKRKIIYGKMQIVYKWYLIDGRYVRCILLNLSHHDRLMGKLSLRWYDSNFLTYIIYYSTVRPNWWLYGLFVSIKLLSFLSSIVYYKFVMLFCDTVLCIHTSGNYRLSFRKFWIFFYLSSFMLR